MRQGWTLAIIFASAVWLMIAGVLLKKRFPRLTTGVQAVVILAGFFLLIYSLIYGFNFRG